MNSLLTKLMSILIGISIIAGGLVFSYLKDTNEDRILETKFQQLNINKIILQQHLKILYRTIFYAYAKQPEKFNRVIESTRYKFIHNIKEENIFKSEGLLIKEGNKVLVVNGEKLDDFFKLDLSEKSINRLKVNNNIYYVSYLKFKPFDIEILFYDTQKEIDKEVLTQTLKTFEIAVIFIVLILFIMFLFIRLVVLKPISELIDSMSKIAKNQYEYIKKEYSVREFNLVKEYFNKMIDAIKSREDKIRIHLKDQEERELFYYDVINSQESIIIVNNTKKIEHVNQAFFKFFDQFASLEEFTQKHNCICDFFEAEDGFVYNFEDKNWVEYLVNNQDKKYKVKIKKDNKYYIFNVSAKKLQYSEKIIITLNDITNLEEEKEKVIELNILLEDYKKAIDAGVIVSKTDTKGIITYVNEEFCKVSGYTKEELLNKPHNIVRHPEVPKEVYKELWDTIKSGKIWKGEIKNRKKDGSSYYVKSIIAPLMNKHGEIIEYIALREDITDLVYAIKKAQEAEKIKMLFLSNMSHEIRTPLNGILGFTELLLKSENLPEKEKKYINIIHSSSQALLQIINDVLDISKIESGNLALEKKEFRPICSFKQAAELFKAKAKEKNINFKIDLDFNLTNYIKSDEFRIRQVISNLIGNAIKFTPENGEVIFSVKQINKTDKKSTLCFSVKDTGIGIPKSKQKDIFKEFTQADNSVSRKYGGTGLGLSISAKIVKALGGELRVRSEEGKGSEFYFCIEVENTELKDDMKDFISELNIALYNVNNIELYKFLEKIVKSVSFESKYDELDKYNVIISKEFIKEYEDRLILYGEIDKNVISIPSDFDSSDILNALIDFTDNKKSYSQQKDDTKLVFQHKVLVAEDNEVNQELIKILFDSKGIKYKIVNNGLKALEAYKNEKFDLVFMDINMPEMNGIEATKEILRYEKENNLKHTPIIALTANAMQDDKEKFLEFMDEYLSKPIIEEELNMILNKYLEAKIEVNEIIYDKNDMAKKLGIPAPILDKVLNKFLETIDSYMNDLQQAIEDNDLEKINYHSHKIKGSMVTFHLDFMVDILKKMEDDAKQGIKRDYKTDFFKVKEELENFKNSMKG